jgi:pyruvate,water dikinase
MLINLGYPDDAFAMSLMPSDGVGLAREEFIISEYIRIHPLALVYPEKVTDPLIQKEIERLTKGYSDKREYFIDKLAAAVGTIAAAFYPREVILRFSDFKTNEYSNLIGGSYFEPKEENPMIGWRGASRYYSQGYKEGFALECAAVRRVRETWGLTNLKVMIPVCRTVDEAKKVLATMKSLGLYRGKKGLKILMMCEVPSNALLMEHFCDLFDGFSIGSNDLTQLTLAVDRDSHLVEEIYDERNSAVKALIQMAIKVAKKKKKKIGICGEAPSTYKEFAEFLIDCGIDSISSAPSSFIKTRQIVASYEAKKRKNRNSKHTARKKSHSK